MLLVKSIKKLIKSMRVKDIFSISDIWVEKVSGIHYFNIQSEKMTQTI